MDAGSPWFVDAEGDPFFSSLSAEAVAHMPAHGLGTAYFVRGNVTGSVEAFDRGHNPPPPLPHFLLSLPTDCNWWDRLPPNGAPYPHPATPPGLVHGRRLPARMQPPRTQRRCGSGGLRSSMPSGSRTVSAG